MTEGRALVRWGDFQEPGRAPSLTSVLLSKLGHPRPLATVVRSSRAAAAGALLGRQLGQLMECLLLLLSRP